MAKKGSFKEHDVVVVKKDGIHVKQGEKGTIIYLYTSGSYEVEFSDGKVVLLGPDEIKFPKDGTVRNTGTDPVQQREADQDTLSQSLGSEGLPDNGRTDDTSP